MRSSEACYIMRMAEIIMVTGDARPDGYSDEKIREDLLIISERIEALFSPSVDEYQIDWVDFCEGDNPCLSYPPCADHKSVRIQLVGPALNDANFARFQLAHELVHCLSPSGGPTATIIEEGAATWFQVYHNRRYVHENIVVNGSSYVSVLNTYNQLLAHCDNPFGKLRTVEPRAYLFNTETFLRAGIFIKKSHRAHLLKSFVL